MSTQIISLETIEQDTIWIAKMQGYRQKGTKAEIGHLFHDEECRDYDISCEQPEHLKPFYDMYLAYEHEHGWITIPDYYNNVYLKQVQEQAKEDERKSEEPVKVKRVWTQEEIKNLVQTNDNVLYGALRKLYAQQTADEQRAGETKVHNNVGFNGADSRFLSSTAEFLNKTGFLTDKQKIVVRRKLVKYTKQLTRLANS